VDTLAGYGHRASGIARNRGERKHPPVVLIIDCKGTFAAKTGLDRRTGVLRQVPVTDVLPAVCPAQDTKPFAQLPYRTNEFLAAA
jgi:hypothetical protein